MVRNVAVDLPQLIRILILFQNLSTQALIETGASFLSYFIFKQLQASKVEEIERDVFPHFVTASGNSIKWKGVFEIKFRIKKKFKFKHKFYVVETLPEGCILGLDFLTINAITVSAVERKIVFSQDDKTIGLTMPVVRLGAIIVDPTDRFDLGDVPLAYQKQIRELLNKNQMLFADEMTELGTASQVKHTIRLTTDNPVCLPYRRTPEALKHLIKEQIEEMEKYGIIRESTSPYAATVVMVPKKTGDMSFCIDL